MNEKTSGLHNIKAVVFDLDGTLIDTEKIYAQIWPITIRELGHEMKREHYLALRSLGRTFAAEKMREWYGEDFDYPHARKIRRGYFNEYVEKHGMERKKGAIELLEYLKNKGIVTAVATATDLDRATDYLKRTGLYDYFDEIISAAMVKQGKPMPDIYLYACETLGLKPEECIAVEDAPNGILSAYRAGCNVIMVPDQSEPDDTIHDMLVACVEDLSQICELI